MSPNVSVDTLVVNVMSESNMHNVQSVRRARHIYIFFSSHPNVDVPREVANSNWPSNKRTVELNVRPRTWFTEPGSLVTVLHVIPWEIVFKGMWSEWLWTSLGTSVTAKRSQRQNVHRTIKAEFTFVNSVIVIVDLHKYHDIYNFKIFC